MPVDGLVVGGKYHVVQLIGQGGMGAVYDAIHAKTGRRIALKLIHERSIAERGLAARTRFDREARAAAAIESLHVVQVLDTGEDERSGMPFIVMEHLDGEDLRTFIDRGPMPQGLVGKIAVQVLLGVKKAHEADIIHRDLKPGNVFVAKADGDRRIVKILDFGVAKLDGSTDQSIELTATGDVVGSPPYMSPEQLRSARDVDCRTDIWAIGVLLYEMLAGVTPTHAVPSLGAKVYAICHEPALRIETLVPGIRPQLAAIVHRALSINPGDRFASAAEMLAALKPLVGNSDVTAQDFDSFEENAGSLAAAEIGPDVGSVGGAALRSEPAPRGRRNLAMVGVTAGGLVATLLVALLVRPPSAQAPPPEYVPAATIAPIDDPPAPPDPTAPAFTAAPVAAAMTTPASTASAPAAGAATHRGALHNGAKAAPRPATAAGKRDGGASASDDGRGWL